MRAATAQSSALPASSWIYAVRFVCSCCGLRRGRRRVGWRQRAHRRELDVYAAREPVRRGSINRSAGRILGNVFSARSAVLAARVGVSVDLHIERFLMGWAPEYEALVHVRGAPLEFTHFVHWTLIPVFRIGVDVGPTVQSLN